ncbi:hypothetical protein [Streptomyces sp. NRRL WC-3742]|uniref:hypothetical protein n=1 Tax=Streptomyces sp. NRRL WC-3742 TaxID=1463934 RepID=UPI0004C6195E|nr:hypothetical protein [Streptomyces sp. NRRL WC-3742]
MDEGEQAERGHSVGADGAGAVEELDAVEGRGERGRGERHREGAADELEEQFAEAAAGLPGDEGDRADLPAGDGGRVARLMAGRLAFARPGVTGT